MASADKLWLEGINKGAHLTPVLECSTYLYESLNNNRCNCMYTRLVIKNIPQVRLLKLRPFISQYKLCKIAVKYFESRSTPMSIFDRRHDSLAFDIRWETSVYPLWPDDAIWCHTTLPALVQVKACCLTAPSHYLVQFDQSSVRYRGIHLRTISPETLKIYLILQYDLEIF